MDRLDRQDRCIDPQTFQLVVIPKGRMEHVYHDVDEVEEGPASRPHTLGMVRAPASALHGLEYPFGQRAHVRVRRAGSDDEDVGGVTHLTEIEHHDILRLMRFEGLDGASQIPKGLVL
jgi:hypothetical protein